MTLAVTLLGAALVGLTLGLLGAGGSILAVPILIYAAGQPAHVAIPTALVIVAISSAGALLPRLRGGQIRWPVATVFAIGGVPAALAGAAVGHRLPAHLLMPGFAVLMVVVAVRMLRDARPVGQGCRRTPGRGRPPGCLLKALSAGAGVGLLTGVFGVGGGFAIVPALTLLLGLTQAEAAATSLVIIVVNSLASFAGHLGTHLDPVTIAEFAGIALVVSVATGRLAQRIPARTVRRIFGWTVIALAPLVALAG